MIILAHDGSLYGDWVARYALQFAAEECDRKLLVLHVLDGKSTREVVTAKLAQLEADCQARDIEMLQELLPLGANVYRSLRQATPHATDALLICGTRLKARKSAFLRGSVAEQLLRSHQCPVLALRVVQPGLLGAPQELLLPLAGHQTGFARIWPIFRRLAPKLRRVHLFRSLNIHHLRHAHLSPAREQLLLKVGQSYLTTIAAQLSEMLPEPGFSIERRVTIASDWPNAALVQASRLKVQMILLGVSERNLAHRVLHGVGLERVLHEACCDVGIYRAP